MVFKSFVGDAIFGTRPIQLETKRNMNKVMIIGASQRPFGPSVASICSCSHTTTISSTFCQPEGMSCKLRVARIAMRRTTAMVIHVMIKVSSLKVMPAN